MGSDRQSILLHQNGKKHKENALQQHEQQVLAKKQEEKSQNMIQQSLRQMESAAHESIASDLGRYAHHNSLTQFLHGPPIIASSVIPATQPTMKQSKPVHNNRSKQEKTEWESRKKERQENSKRKDPSDEDTEGLVNKRRRIQIQPGEGDYEYSGKTYLEGVAFGGMLEVDMPIQLWTGSALANATEKKLPERRMYWKHGLVVSVREQPTATEVDDRLVVDVSYLQQPEDTQETIEKSVSLSRIRIELGADFSIPDNVEEARLLAMGGEEITLRQQHTEIDEATGLSSWTTVKITRTSARQEIKDERERLREQRKEAAIKEASKAKENESRRMEEAKVANAEDSALGAFDVWSRTKDGYKGVAIHEEASVDIHELGKKLADGKSKVAFKKKDMKVKQKRQNQRVTSADDAEA
jgi:WW domain-binding protein 4